MTETYTYYQNIDRTRVRSINSGILIMVIMLLFSQYAQSQDCTTEITNTFVCNEKINVSLGGDCAATINPGAITEGLLYGDASYTVEIEDEDGNILPTNIMGPEHHEQLFTVSVTQICSGYSCWGYMYVEDKVGPSLSCTTAVSDCMSTEPGDFGFPVPITSVVTLIGDKSYNVNPVGECDDFTLTYRDRKVDYSCDSTYIQIIYRTWHAEDSFGNISTCIDTISVLPGSVADITFPPHYDNIDQPAFECHDSLETLENGNPSTTETGSLGGVDCVNIISYFEDLNFEDVCGASKKVLRTWNILDWCTGEDLIYDQVIKILDLTAPIIEETRDTVIYTLPHKCYARYEVPLPIVDDCSEWTYSIRHKQLDTLSDPYTNSTAHNVKYDEINNTFTIDELPFGQSWISVYVRDDCGFVTDTFYVVDVQDKQLPNPICDHHTTLSLDNNNTAKLFASSLNDGSLDNCGIAELQVRRMVDSCNIEGNTIFGDFVKFCCADAGDTVMVALRAEDRSGNVNTCMIEVRIADELPPLFRYCPRDTIIDCSLDYMDLNVTGIPEVYDNCNYVVTHSDLNQLNSCGIGTVVRTWRAEDDFGNYSECWQEITVTSDDTIKLNSISWPEDRIEYGCLNGNFTPEITGEPEVFVQGCAQLWVDYNDEIFYSLDHQCSKILRTWRVTNECLDWYNTSQEFIHIQYIKVIEEVAPVFNNCKDTTIIVSGDHCLNEIDLDFEAYDNCTPEKELKYHFSIDYDKNGIDDISGIGNSLLEDFGFGTALVSFTAKDHCGNVGECEFELTIKDEKAPTPVCVPVSWSLGEGEVEIWASDFSLKSFDNCTPEHELILSFSEDPNEAVRIFTCDDIENGVGAEVPITLYVFDESGNFDFCETKLLLTDTNDKCEDAENVSLRIAGYLETEEGRLVTDVDVNIMMHEEPLMSLKTSQEGAFMAEGFQISQNLTIAPEKNDDYMNGVTTLDLVLIQRHILSSPTIESPYKLIAADINNSGGISAADLIQLRKMILGILDGFPSNKSWRFVDKSHQFVDIRNPWSFPEHIIINELMTDQMENDFIGIKVGDVNNSVTLSEGDDAAVRNAQNIFIDLDQAVEEDGNVLLPVFLDDDSEVIGMQFSIGLKKISQLRLRPGTIPIAGENYTIHADRLDISWSDIAPAKLVKNEALFFLEIDALRYNAVNGDIIKLVDGLNSEAYTVDLDVMALNIHLRDHTQIQTNTIISNVVLLQNNPNPFTDVTEILISSNVEEEAEMTVMNIHGHHLMQKSISLEKGMNSIQIQTDQEWSSGIYFYMLKGKTVNTSMKMIKQ